MKLYKAIFKPESEPQKPNSIPALLLISGLFVFVIMAFMAWLLFKERMLNFDPAFFSFLMLQEEWFSPVLGRYGTILSQLLPFSLMKAGADLNTILRFYSLSYVLLYILYLLIIGLKLKSRKGIIAISIALTLTFRETFFYASAELYQAIGLSVLLWSLFNHTLSQSGIRRLIGLVLCGITVLGISFFHQLAIFTVFFVLSVTYLQRRKWKDWGAVGLLIWTVIWFVFRIKFLTVSEYEQDRLLTTKVFFEGLSKIPTLATTHYFADFFLNHLIIPVIVSVLALGYLTAKRYWLLSAYVVLYVIGFWLIIMIGVNSNESPIMLQNYFTVFGLFSGVVIALALDKKPMWISASAVLILGLFSLKNIYQSRYDYQVRTEFLEHLAEYGQQFPEKKYVMHAQHLPWGFVWINWALSIETLLTSELEPELESVTYYSTFQLDTLDAYDIERPESFLGPAFEPHWFSGPSLNHTYFSIPNGSYRILNSQGTEFSLNDSLLALKELQVRPYDGTINKHGGRTTLKIEFANHTQSQINSIYADDEGLYLYYRIFTEHGEIWKTNKKRLLFDLFPEKHYTDIIPYEHPDDPRHTMEIGFFNATDSIYFPKAKITLNSQ